MVHGAFTQFCNRNNQRRGFMRHTLTHVLNLFTTPVGTQDLLEGLPFMYIAVIWKPTLYDTLLDSNLPSDSPELCNEGD